jgi:hypothetical protein
MDAGAQHHPSEQEKQTLSNAPQQGEEFVFGKAGELG